MVKEEFNLSEKRKTNDQWKPSEVFGFYWESDVKEFIEKILEDIGNNYNIQDTHFIKELIKQRAGDLLL